MSSLKGLGHGTWDMSIFSGFPHLPSRFLQLAQVFAAEARPGRLQRKQTVLAEPRRGLHTLTTASRFSVRWYLLEIKPAPGKLKPIHAIKGTGGSDYE